MRPVLLRVKPGKLKIGASFTSQVVTLGIPSPKIIEQVNRATKQSPYPVKKTLVALTLDQGVLKVRVLYPGDPQILKALGKENPQIQSLVNRARARYGLGPINETTLKGIMKSLG